VWLISARQRVWARARVAVPGVLLFTLLTLVATLIRLDLFRMDCFFGWAWLVVYMVVPSAIIVGLVGQLRVAGDDPPRQSLYRGGCG